MPAEDFADGGQYGDDDINDGGDVLIPSGLYLMALRETVTKLSKQKQTRYNDLKLELLGGPNKGMIFRHELYLQGNRPIPQNKWRWAKALGIAAKDAQGNYALIDGKDWPDGIGLKVVAHVVKEPREKDDLSKGYRSRVKLMGVFRPDEPEVRHVTAAGGFVPDDAPTGAAPKGKAGAANGAATATAPASYDDF